MDHTTAAPVRCQTEESASSAQPTTTTPAGAIAGTFIASPVAIGKYWPGQGGIYLGITRSEGDQPDAHLVMAVDDSGDDLAWSAAIEWAKSIHVDGHTDFHLPTRTESALIYANGRHQVDDTSWHWTSTEANSGSFAWDQLFGYGFQLTGHKSYEGRARAVRRFDAWSFNPSEVSA